ncbi:ABC transporter ATP-binding protein [Furfurilactobacillus milii]|uniref:ABC-type quaternary amine transporter n=1 Tax=Furfurilactobacillus rossiae TaxID=231049 RepID=A0A7C9NB69_9LACO|nr:ABC transporter ATP-binding protein [Furfurilactobacillus milii]MYV05710.1 ATP-binding cassette domain-containing protein [Furfurilactobacillus milii]
MAETLITFDHVKKNYGNKQAVDDVSFTVNRGEIFVLVGASGSGKTTTLRMINELLEPTYGNIYFNGKRIKDYNVRELRLQTGYVLQQIALFPNMTVAQNVALIPSMKKQSKADTSTLVDQLLNDVDLDPQTYRDRMPDELSGGEQQRVGILRAFAGQPQIVLMDEPFSALDPISRTQLQNLVIDIHHRLNTTVVFVTHDMDEALKLGDRIGVMRLGKLLQVGTPDEIVRHPADQFVQRLFENSMAHDVYHVLLSKLSVMGYLQDVNDPRTTASGDERVTLTGDQTVSDALTPLESSEAVLIQSEGGPARLLTRDQLFKFIGDYRSH